MSCEWHGVRLLMTPESRVRGWDEGWNEGSLPQTSLWQRDGEEATSAEGADLTSEAISVS